MKKSFKWLLCASLVFSSAFAVACSEEETEPEAHEHTWAATYSTDSTKHWYAATCEHTDEKMGLETHTDADNDGVCDKCEYDAHQGAGHTFASEWTQGETHHWHAANCGHTVDGADKAEHVDANNDKSCDVCEYDYNHTHTYATTWSKDDTHHWYAATCGCSIEGIDKAAHVDEDSDGVCEICLNGPLDEWIATATSDAFTSLVKSGVVNVTGWDEATTTFEYGTDCFHSANEYYEYWYMAVGNGNVMGIMLTEYDDETSMEKAYGTTAGNLNGVEISVGYADGETAYGVADAIATFYNLAKVNGNMEFSVNEETKTFSFSGYNANSEKFTVTYVVATTEIDEVEYSYISSLTVAVEDEYDTTYEVEQVAGARTAVSPYDPDELIAASYDLEMYALTYADWDWTEADSATEFATDLTIMPNQGYRFYLTNANPNVESFSFDEFTITINGEEYVDGMQVNADTYSGYFEILVTSAEAGNYEIVVSTYKVTNTFSVTVFIPAPTEIFASQYSQVYYEMMPISELSVFIGEEAKFYSMVNSGADSSYTAAITSANAENATLTLGESDYFGVPYTFSATVAGTYTVVLTSTADANVTGTLTITVNELPGADELLVGYKGYYQYEWYFEADLGIGVLFTPTEAGATTGTAVIDLFDVNSSFNGVAYSTGTVSYAYDAGTGAVTLTYVDGVNFVTDNYLEMSIQNGKLYVSIYVQAMMDFPGELTECERPEIPEADDDEPAVAGTFAGTYTATYMYDSTITFDVVITDTTITFTPVGPGAMQVVWTYEINGNNVTLYDNGMAITMPMMGYVEMNNGVASMMYNNGTQYTLVKKVEFAGTYTATHKYNSSVTFTVVITDTTITFTPVGPGAMENVWTYTLEGDVITLFDSTGAEITNPLAGGMTVSGGVATAMSCNGSDYTLTK